MSAQSDEIAFGSDSFLDVMANMVGVLVILVTIAVMRSAPRSAEHANLDPQTAARIDELTAQVESAEKESSRLAGQSSQLEQSAAETSARARSLAGAISERSRLVDDVRLQAARRTQELDETRRSLAEVNAELARAKDEASKPPKDNVKVVESYTTPISRIVTGKELHFQLASGRITIVPMEELEAAFEREARQNVDLLRDRDQVTGYAGPVGDFRLRYTLELGGRHHGSSHVVASFVLIPLEGMTGETIERALAPNSDFRDALSRANPRRTTVTLWTYPDGFEGYRALRKLLFQQGWTVACRPMENGQPIGASTEGSRSSTQ